MQDPVLVGLVAAAVAVASLAGRLRAPAPSLLVIAGLLVGLIPGVPAESVPPNLIAVIVLPPLLHAAAQQTSLPELRRVAVPVAALAVGLVVVTAAAVAAVVHLMVPSVGVRPAFVVGAALASTDPVAVAALARRLHLPSRLLTIVQGESLLNDATSLVLFTVALSVTVHPGPVDVPGAVGQFVRLGLGGAAVGAVIGVVVVKLHRRSTQPLFDVAVSLVTPFAAYVGAQALGCSGVTAVVVSGFVTGSRWLSLYDGRTRLIVGDVYEVVVFLLESTVFAVIGLGLPSLWRALPPGDGRVGLAILAVVGTLLATRAVWVFGTVATTTMTLRPSAGGPAEDRRWRRAVVATWAGTRGVVPLTAALSIPLTVQGGGGFPDRNLLLLLVSAVIAATLVVQGFTLEPLVRRFRVSVSASERTAQERLARRATADAALAWLDAADTAGAGPEDLDALRGELLEQSAAFDPAAAADPIDDHQRWDALARIRRGIAEAQSEELARLSGSGRITDSVRRRVQRSLDVAEAATFDRLTE